MHISYLYVVFMWSIEHQLVWVHTYNYVTQCVGYVDQHDEPYRLDLHCLQTIGSYR